MINPGEMRILDQAWVQLQSVGVLKSREIAHGIRGTVLWCSIKVNVGLFCELEGKGNQSHKKAAQMTL